MTETSSRLTGDSQKVLFYFQLFMIFCVAITSIINIILKTGNMVLWTSLLSSSIGYILPTPRLRKSLLNTNL